MLIFTSPYRTAVFLARIVIPFSRSRSIESSTRSATSWFSRNDPDGQSMASTSVVFPWSTCATMATSRMSSRNGTSRRVAADRARSVLDETFMHEALAFVAAERLVAGRSVQTPCRLVGARNSQADLIDAIPREHLFELWQFDAS